MNWSKLQNSSTIFFKVVCCGSLYHHHSKISHVLNWNRLAPCIGYCHLNQLPFMHSRSKHRNRTKNWSPTPLICILPNHTKSSVIFVLFYWLTADNQLQLGKVYTVLKSCLFETLAWVFRMNVACSVLHFLRNSTALLYYVNKLFCKVPFMHPVGVHIF